MAVINASGLSVSTAVGEGQPALLIGASGLSSASAVGLGANALIHGVSGLSITIAVGLGNFVRFPKIVSAVVVSSTKVRINFDAPMKNDVALINPINYTIATTTPGAAVPSINSVSPEGVPSPTFVELTTGEHTDAASYTVAVLAGVGLGGPTDSEGTPIDVAFQSVPYAGIGDAPKVESVESISLNRANVKFNEAMRDNPEIRDPALYTWDNGLVTLNVLDFQDDLVQLVTTDQVPGVFYTLTIAP